EGVEAALEGASARLEAQPCCWLDHRLARAMRAIRHVHGSSALVSKLESQLTPAPGQVPLLLVSPDGRGHVLELTIRAATPGSGSRLDPLFRRTASDAIHRAYEAASSLCAGAVAPRSLYDHDFLVKGGEGFEGIEGDSLSLPIALAFLSLWSQTPLPGDLAMTGALFGSTSAGWRVGSVQGVQAKAMALAEEAAGPVRLLVPSGAQVTGDVDDVSVSSLSDAVRASGIVLTLDTVETEAGDAQSMLQSLSRMTSHV